MALQKQQVPIILGAGGVDTKLDPKIVQPGKLLSLQNARFTVLGTLSKRFGYDDLDRRVLGGGTISLGRKLGVFNDELLLMDGSKIYSYVESNNAWADRSYLTSISVVTEPVIRNTASQTGQHGAFCKGVSVFAWEDSRGGARATVIDQSSGLPIISDFSLNSSGEKPRCSSTANYLYVHYVVGTNMYVRRLNPLSPTSFEAAVLVTNDVNDTTPNFDISPYGQNLVISYETTGNVVKTGFLTQTGEIGTGLNGFPSPVSTTDSGSGSVAVVARLEGDSNDGVYVFYANTTDGVQCTVYATDLTSTATSTIDPTTTDVKQMTALVDGGLCYIWYQLTAASAYNTRIKSDSITRAGSVASGGTGYGFIRSLGIGGKAFFGSDGNIYLVGTHESALQPTYFTLRFISYTRALAVNNIAPLTGGGLISSRSNVPAVFAISTTLDEFIFPSLSRSKLVSEEGTIFGQIGVGSSRLSLGDRNLYQSKQLGENLHIAGGLLQAYDGQTCTELGFNFFPEDMSATISMTPGNLTAGVRLYSLVYEWTDAQGQVHQSAPSIGYTATNGANEQNILVLPTLRVTEKKVEAGRSPVSIVVYRTVAAGSIFYRVSSISSPVLNDVSVDTVTVNDNVSDATLVSRQILYTTGGILENIQPQSSIVMENYKGRLIANSSEDKTITQYSKPWVIDEGVAFTDAFQFRTAQEGGPITAYWVLDDKLIIFKAGRIYAQIGNGPTDTGALDDFQPPQLITTDCGCPFPVSITNFSDGIVFKSNKGYYILTRGLETQYIGKDVEAFNNLECTGAILVESENEIRFTHSDGVQLVYDTFARQWGTDTGLTAESCAVWQTTPVILKSNGLVYVENPETYKDAGAPISMQFVTPWLSMAQLQGAQRLYRILLLGQLKSAHLLMVQVEYNFQEGARESFTFNSEQVMGSSYYGSDAYFGAADYNGTSQSLYQMEILPFIQKCESIRFTIYDLNPQSIDGAGYSITGMLAIVGVKAGPYRLPTANRLTST